jgi:acetylornithine deacetylase/succinyl-diaminopimelate desuccinylase-like protein
MKQLQETAQAVIQTYAGILPGVGSGSTDCNIPLSMDIPAVCPGVVRGGGAHTREEYILRSSLLPGLKVGLSLILSYLT